MGAILGLYRDYIGIMQKKMSTTILHRVYIYIGIVLGLYRDNGRENGNCHSGFRVFTWVFHKPHKTSFEV